MKLSDFFGKHVLSGVDFETVRVGDDDDGFYEDANSINFLLDGETYAAIENPSDGYRSILDEVKKSDHQIKNIFHPTQVLGIKRADGDYSVNNTVEFYDIENGKLVLAFGTDNDEDYYPSFVAEWIPENLHYNKGLDPDLKPAASSLAAE